MINRLPRLAVYFISLENAHYKMYSSLKKGALTIVRKRCLLIGRRNGRTGQFKSNYKNVAVVCLIIVKVKTLVYET